MYIILQPAAIFQQDLFFITDFHVFVKPLTMRHDSYIL